eukprot:7067-Heterococcus_DN1.PRE.3
MNALHSIPIIIEGAYAGCAYVCVQSVCDCRCQITQHFVLKFTIDSGQSCNTAKSSSLVNVHYMLFTNCAALSYYQYHLYSALSAVAITQDANNTLYARSSLARSDKNAIAVDAYTAIGTLSPLR